jgi:hypothetical protein
MEKKKMITTIVVAIVLYTIISLILEKTFSKEVILAELFEGLIFGLVYALFLVIWNRFKKNGDG